MPKYFSVPSSIHIIQHAPLIWLAWTLLVAVKQLIRFFPAPDAPLNGDARWVYLPNARLLMDDPWGFLTKDPSSLHVAPLGYIWPALWGADVATIQLVNCVLFLACIVLMWRSATRLGGIWAGIVSTALLAYYPEFRRYIPQVLTESIFLFGLMLWITSSIEYITGNHRRFFWLFLGGTGLAITLLARPVLQLFAVCALVLVTAACWCLRKTAHRTISIQSVRDVINKHLCVALLAALLLPATIVLKNGVCFGFWGISTGAGTGLYYGVSPFKMGLEPVFSGFSYDAGHTPRAVAPETLGNPLKQLSDSINRRVALNIIENTSLSDNLKFFAFKLKAWLFYSTPELRITPKLRTLRTFEWIVISAAAFLLCARALRKIRSERSSQWIATCGQTPRTLVIFTLLLTGALAMALQLTPVLYNGRYNLFFMEPWLILLAGQSVAILLSRSEKFLDGGDDKSTWRWLISRIGLTASLIALPLALTKHSMENETWAMDPYRPGPTEVVLDRKSMGAVRAQHGSSTDGLRWRIEETPFQLHIPLHPSDVPALSPDHTLDAIWRFRFAIELPDEPLTQDGDCRKAALSLSNAYTLQDWYRPDAALQLKANGVPQTYAISGNAELRPAGPGELTITFHCPKGTYVSWESAELLRSTLAEAAYQYIHHGRAINPYRLNEPQ